MELAEALAAHAVRELDNPHIAHWCAALRSGDYKQGTGVMKHIDSSTGKVSWCCLGVACDIGGALLTRGRDFGWDTEGGGFYYSTLPSLYVPGSQQGSSTRLPEYLREALDLDDARDESFFASLNDGGQSFAYIADVLELGYRSGRPWPWAHGVLRSEPGQAA